MISGEELQRTKETLGGYPNRRVVDNLFPERLWTATPAELNYKIVELITSAEHWAREDALKEVEDRLMPEGMSWPRFEDGAQLHFGDFVQFEDISFMVNDVAFGVDKTVTMRNWAADQGGVWRNELWLRVIRPKPSDTWEKLEEDAGKLSCDYWDCPNGSCEACRALIEGEKPRDFYCVSNCTKAQKHDIVARAKRLAEGGE